MMILPANYSSKKIPLTVFCTRNNLSRNICRTDFRIYSHSKR